MEEKIEKLPAHYCKDLHVTEIGSYKFWIYTEENCGQKELYIQVYKNEEFSFTKIFNFKNKIISDIIRDFIFINDNTILFLFINESEVMLKIMDSKKILITQNKKNNTNIKDEDFISIYKFNLSVYDEANYRYNKILFNENGDKLILLAYSVLYFLDYNKQKYDFQLMSKFIYKKKIYTFLYYFNNIIYAFSDEHFFIFDILKNKILKEITYSDKREDNYFRKVVCFSKSKKYLAYSCGNCLIFIFDTENFIKKECYNLDTKIRTKIIVSEQDKNKGKPTEYYITGIIPFKEYFLFSKVKHVTLMPATNRGSVSSYETQFVDLKIKENKKKLELLECDEILRINGRLKVFYIKDKAFYTESYYCY